MHHATIRAPQEDFERRRGKRFEADWPIIIKGKDGNGIEIEEESSLININK